MTRVSGLSLAHGRVLNWGRVPAVMAIINVTPDSFSEGGLLFDPVRAVEAALAMESDGAAVLDIGGESTRPGSTGCTPEEELKRVLPVIEGIRRHTAIPISIDTTRARTAAAAIDAGADMINDVSGLTRDEGMAELAAERGCPVILMHMRGTPDTMQSSIEFDDLLGEIEAELRDRCAIARAAGVQERRILVDPGIGFGKTQQHNLEILARCDRFTSIAPTVIGASRKAFVGAITGREAGPARAAGSLAAVAAAARGGAAIVRVHDVRETVDFLRVWDAIEGAA